MTLSRRVVPFVLALVLYAADPLYRSVSVDDGGQLHIVLDSAKEIVPPKLEDQIAFSSPAISPDHRTVGWLAEYPYQGYSNRTLSGRLVLYRGGSVLQSFSTEQVFWDWQFQDGGNRVAYSTGPTHGGAAECVLRDVDSGKVLDHWYPKEGTKAPAWAAELRV